MEIEIDDPDGRPVCVRVAYDAPLELMLSELQTIPYNIFPDDPRLRARLRGLLDVSIAQALKVAAHAVLDQQP
jgi:hypothetical protein